MKSALTFGSEWGKVLHKVLKNKTFLELLKFIQNEYKTKTIFPKEADIFKVFTTTPYSSIKVVILGQDPYHGDGQAEGLSFSVPEGQKLPPSLKNIYKEIEKDIGIKKDITNGNLGNWSKQGVFLLNSVLTVEAHTPLSHKRKGWEVFTDEVIKIISDRHEHVVFMVWGTYARSKRILINEHKHLILEAPHPSPLSAYTGFFGCKHFSKCNQYLKMHNKQEIIW